LTLSSGFTICFAFLLNDLKIIKITNPGLKHYLVGLGVPALVAGVFSYYKYNQMKVELDKKYTPIYLKSRGKL
jgi:hypothetical protein